MFDITLSPLFVEGGREQMEMPGLLAVTAPRKAARLRAQDQLILYLKIAGSTHLTAAQQQEMLTKLAETYFTTPGPITSGLRAVIVRLNDFLLNRNLRGAREGQAVAVLGLAAIRSNSLLLAHGGSTHTFLLGKNGLQHFQDNQGVRGLGLGKQIIPRFFQASVEPGDMLLFCAEPPDGWNPRSLPGTAQGGGSAAGIEPMRRRLLGQAGMDLHAGLARLQTGKGQVIWFKPAGKKEPEPSPQAAAVETTAPVTQAQPATPAPTLSEPETADRPQPQAVEAQPAAQSRPESGPARDHLRTQGLPPSAGSARPTRAAGEPGTFGRPAQAARPVEREPSAEKPSSHPAKPAAAQKAPKPAKPAAPGRAVMALRKALAAVFGAWAAAKTKLRQAVRHAAAQAFPNRSEPFFNLSPGAMLAIAVFTPMLVVSVAAAVYMNAGRAEQMALSLYTAQQYAERAPTQADLKAQRDDWNQVLLWVRKANEMGESEQGKVLSQQAQNALDAMDGIVRVEFQPVTPVGLGVDVRVTRIVATLNDAYLLDASQGRIIRLYRTGSGYAIDPEFTCGPGKAGGQIVGPLISMAALPPNNDYRATIMGIDAAGVLVYCSPNQSGFDSRPLTPPDTGWGKIVGMTTQGDTLYVLDPQFNAVWFYAGDKGVYGQSPRLFFDSQVPQMDDIVDFAVDQEFLYLLHADGRMTLCEGSGFEFQPTRCSDPAPYGDNRPDRETAPLRFEDARFIQVQTTQPPDPSLFILDDAGQAVYHFSLRRLNYQRQYRQLVDADFPFPKSPPTAFAITPNRLILVAFEDKVFFGAIP